MIKKDNYERIAECIQGEQMSAPEISELFEDGKFLKWYRKEFNLDSDKEETLQINLRAQCHFQQQQLVSF